MKTSLTQLPNWPIIQVSQWKKATNLQRVIWCQNNMSHCKDLLILIKNDQIIKKDQIFEEEKNIQNSP